MWMKLLLKIFEAQSKLQIEISIFISLSCEKFVHVNNTYDSSIIAKPISAGHFADVILCQLWHVTLHSSAFLYFSLIFFLFF